jgi:hypothetical protein
VNNIEFIHSRRVADCSVVAVRGVGRQGK